MLYIYSYDNAKYTIVKATLKVILEVISYTIVLLDTSRYQLSNMEY